MVWLIWVCLGLLFAVFGFGMWRKMRDVFSGLEEFADEHGLNYVETGMLGFNVTGEYRGRFIELNQSMRQVGNRTSTKLMLTYHVPLDVDLAEDFVIRDFQSQRYEGVRMEEFEVLTEDSTFDGNFTVQSSDRAAAYDVLDDELRERLMGHQAAANILKLQPSSRFVVFDGEELVVTTFRLPFSAETIIDRLDEVVETAELLERRLHEYFPTSTAGASPEEASARKSNGTSDGTSDPEVQSRDAQTEASIEW